MPHMKTIYLKTIASGAYMRIVENVRTRNNLGLIHQRKDGFWLWVKKEPSVTGALLYSAKERSSFQPHRNNPDSTPCGGSGYLGGRRFSDMAGAKSFLKKLHRSQPVKMACGRGA